MSFTFSEEGQQVAEAADRPAEIRGVVEAASSDRLWGWVWNAVRPEERVAVELRLGGVTVASSTANLARPDLVKAGIGDGCHAFEVPLTPEWAERQAELSVVARVADGTEASIAIRTRRPTDDSLAWLKSAIEALATGQRLLHEEVRVAAASHPAEQVEALRGLVAAQGDLADRLDTLLTNRLDLLSLWLTRLDKRLATLEEATQPLLLRRSLDAWQIVLTAVLAAVGSAALASAVLVLGR